MSRVFLIGLLVLAGSTGVHAATCVPGTLADYVSLGAAGCDISGTIFSKFEIVPGQAAATPIAANAVQVTPGGTALSPLLLFTYNQTANAAELLESIFRFNVTAGLADATIQLNDPSIQGEFATITGVMNICQGSPYPGTSPSGCPGTESQDVVALSQSGSDLTATRTFGTFNSFFDVFFDITLDPVDGTASLPSAQFGVTTSAGAAIPEPGTMALLLAGGVILWARATRRR